MNLHGTAESGDISEQTCKIHRGQPMDYICLDGDCSKLVNCCILCIKNDHWECNNDLILDKGELSDKVTIQKVNAADIENLNKDFQDFFQEMHACLTQKYKKYMSSSLMFASSEQLTLKALMTSDDLSSFKEYCQVAIEEDGQIIVTPKNNPSNTNVNVHLRDFKENLRQEMDSFASSLNEIKFCVAGEFNLKNFSWHKNIGGTILFSHRQSLYYVNVQWQNLTVGKLN